MISLRSPLCIVIIGLVAFFILARDIDCKKYKDEKEKPQWAKKDIRDYSDADLERLYEQWEEDDEPLEEDELPEYKRPSPQINLADFDPSNPESILKASKRGKSLMAFVSLIGEPTRDETEQVTTLWQTALLNNHIIADRYLIDDNRAIFMFKDGAQAWDAKDYLITQEKLDHIMIENKPYYGPNSPNKHLGDVPPSAASSKDEL